MEGSRVDDRDGKAKLVERDITYSELDCREFMPRLIEFPLDKGGSIIVEETSRYNTGKPEKAGKGNEIILATKSLESSLENIKDLSEEFLLKLSDLSKNPNEFEIEFSIGLQSTGNIVVTSLSAEANFKVNLRWYGTK